MYLNLIAKMNIIVKNNIYNGFYGKLLLKIDYQQRLYIRIVVDKSVRKKINIDSYLELLRIVKYQ
jgi:hypothetical protein